MNDKKSKTISIGFIGGGRITGIFLHAWQKDNALPESIVISDSNPDVLSKIKGNIRP
jgi:pyrroline-5-carboxylate reductase